MQNQYPFNSTAANVLHFFSLILLFYLGIGLMAWFFAESLIFQPPTPSYTNSEKIMQLKTPEGRQVAALYLRNPEAEFTILLSHGNAEDIGYLLPLLKEINALGFSVFAYDYRGYGLSSGKPSEQNTYQDVTVAYNYLVEKAGVLPSSIIAHGRSLGGAVAVDLATRKPVGGLIMESSFVTAYRVMTSIPLLPFDQYRNIEKIDKIDCPLLVIHGKQDRVIPFWHGESLFKKAQDPKQHLWVEQAGHNNLFNMAPIEYRNALTDFVRSIADRKASGQSKL